MPAEDDISLAEKRVYAGSAGRTDVYLASGMGLVRVAVSADKIGEFGIAERADARDVAVAGGPAKADADANERPRRRLALATAEDLLVARLPSSAEAPDAPARSRADASLEFTSTGLGPTAAVGVHDGAFVAATADGDVRRVDPEAAVGTEADHVAETAAGTRLGRVEEPTAVDGPLVAAADGVHRVVGDTLERVGLSKVRDVAGTGVPLAATATGLYWLGNGWMDALDGGFRAVAADGDGHALAVDDGGDLSIHRGRRGEFSTDEWDAASLPVADPVAAVGYGPGLALAATDAGTLCVDAGDGWRHRTVGVREVRGLTAVPAADGR
ncbi:HVO_0234 family beta-propeller protein [Haloparvum sedimenti]|uniref:HVO_0234 family beta-propeller protein n=1 Tax=Haloparvum sedimenti TaxID=1678448 RepID=UPI00071E6E1A|nr:hypothetical protein [Haloparvum sedimenti]